MGRLFWKIFLIIGLTQLAAVLGVGTLIWLEHQQRDAHWRWLDHSPEAHALVADAAFLLQQEGAEALALALGDSPLPLYALDNTGRELLERPLPAALLGALQHMPEHERAARWVGTPDGRLWHLFVLANPDASPLDLAQPGPPGDHHGPHGPPPRPRFPTLPLLAAILVSLVSSALLAWYFAKPIRHLRAGIAAAAAGRLDQQVSAGMGRRRDELADLGRDFDRMSGQLRQLLDSRRRLLHDVSHELRSPLARLQAAIGLARQQPDKLESYLQRIERESERMDQLVGELLTLARLEADASTVGSECFNLGELLGEISEDARFEAEAHGRQLTLHGDFDCPLQGNSELLYRAIENVIRNAIRHTPPDSAVEVAGQRTERTFSLSIRDHGPGLTAADLEKIFAPFYRAATSEPSTGHGLGLTLARRVIEAHGGQITARNHPAGGLEMHIELPQQR